MSLREMVSATSHSGRQQEESDRINRMRSANEMFRVCTSEFAICSLGQEMPEEGLSSQGVARCGSLATKLVWPSVIGCHKLCKCARV
eukprot:13864126-Alexandrium_andersonii.AAC.1